MTTFRLSAFADEAAKGFADQLTALRRHGIDMIEIRGVDGKNIADLTCDEARAVRAMMDDAGIALSALGSPFGKHPVDQPFEKHFNAFRHGLELTQILGGDKIRMFSFFMPAGDDPANWRSKVIDQLGQMLEAAQEAGIRLCHENEKGIYGDTCARCMDILTALPDLGCVFDPANFIQCGEAVVPAFDALAPRLTYMHIKDALAESGAVVPAGKGDGQFPQLIDRLKGMDRPMVMTLEPHLRVFDGLSGLQDEALVNRYTYPDSAAAFAAAVEALRALL